MLGKRKSTCWISIGICLFILPMLCYPFVRVYLDETNYENRYPAEKPKVSLENYSTYARQYEEHFNDTLPYRNQFVRGLNRLKYQVFKENIGLVINGKDGWLFYAGANAVNRYKRNSFFDESYMQELTENMTAIKESLEEQGIAFVLLLLPDKEEVYEEYMPDYYTRPEGLNRTDILVDYMRQNSEINLVYPKQEMRREKGDYQLYFKCDTHYNCLGAFIAYEQTMDALGKSRRFLSELEVKKERLSDRPSGKGDLENMMGFSGVFNKDYEYYVSEYPLLKDWEQEEYTNPEGIYEEKVLLVGDSYRISLLPYFSKDFKNIRTVDFLACSQEVLDEYQPDTVILELLERNDEHMSYYNFANIE